MLQYLLASLIALTVGAGVTAAFYEYKDIQEREVEDRRQAALLGLAAELNQQAPVIIDEHTRLDSVDTLSGVSLIHNYTVLVEMSLPEKRQLVERFKPMVIDASENNLTVKALRGNGVDVIYVFRDTGGAELGRIILEDGKAQ